MLLYIYYKRLQDIANAINNSTIHCCVSIARHCECNQYRLVLGVYNDTYNDWYIYNR